MKKIMAMIAGLALLLIGCEKEELSPTQQDALAVSIKSNVANDKAGPYDENSGSGGRKFIDNGIRGHGCVCHAGNCLATVVVKGLSKPLLDEVFDLGALGDVAKTKQYFAENFSKLKVYIPSSAIEAVIDGNLNLKVKGYNKVKERFLLFTTEEADDPELVIPFTEGVAESCGS